MSITLGLVILGALALAGYPKPARMAIKGVFKAAVGAWKLHGAIKKVKK